MDSEVNYNSPDHCNNCGFLIEGEDIEGQRIECPLCGYHICGCCEKPFYWYETEIEGKRVSICDKCYQKTIGAVV